MRSVLRCAVRWGCTKTGQQLPTDDSELWYVKLRAAMLRLTSDVVNVEGLNVVDLATVRGAVSLLDELLNTPDVYRFRHHDSVVYDITYLTPQTCTPESISTTGRLSTSKKKKNSVAPSAVSKDASPSKFSAGRKSATVDRLTFLSDSTTTTTITHPRTSKSCLDLIVEMEDEISAARILDISPFRQLVQNYWKTYQWLYGTLMTVHIVFMIVYTVYVLPDSATIIRVYSNASSTQSCRALPNSDLFGLFLIWPCLILAFLLYYTVSTVFRYYSSLFTCLYL